MSSAAETIITGESIKPAHSLSRSTIRKAVVSSVIGNGLEWYDFIIYGFFTAAISRTYFPASDVFVSTLLATATFAISFAVRPIGGVLLGMYADRVGRKPTLTLMILLMGLSTLIIGATPSYEAVGIIAPLLVIFARMLQGISVGGEFASATAMLAEYAPSGKKGFYSSFQMCSQALALALAGLSGYALSTFLSSSDLDSWGWRIPFLLGMLIAPVGFYIRRHVDESPEFARLAYAGKRPVKLPFKDVIARHHKALLAGFGAIVVATTSNYVWFVYLPVYVVQQLKLPFSTVLLSTFMGGTLLFILCPITGALGDRFGLRRVFLFGAVLYGLLAYPLFSYVLAAPGVERMIVAQLLCVLAMGFMWGPAPGLLASLFPVEVRSTGMSVSYNIAVLLFGGLAPLTLTWLLKVTGDNMVPAYYIIISTIIALMALWVGRDTKVA